MAGLLIMVPPFQQRFIKTADQFEPLRLSYLFLWMAKYLRSAGSKSTQIVRRVSFQDNRSLVQLGRSRITECPPCRAWVAQEGAFDPRLHAGVVTRRRGSRKTEYNQKKRLFPPGRPADRAWSQIPCRLVKSEIGGNQYVNRARQRSSAAKTGQATTATSPMASCLLRLPALAIGLGLVPNFLKE